MREALLAEQKSELAPGDPQCNRDYAVFDRLHSADVGGMGEGSIACPAECIWTVARPASITSAGNATPTKQADGSILFSGTRPEVDTYTFVVHTNLKGITGVRLEVLTDAGLPKRRTRAGSDNGNFHLSEFQLKAAPLSGCCCHQAGRAAECVCRFRSGWLDGGDGDRRQSGDRMGNLSAGRQTAHGRIRTERAAWAFDGGTSTHVRARTEARRRPR